MEWDAVVFDFDGVILDSMGVKTRAFAQLFKEYGPEIEKQVVDYHLSNGGVSRYDKFRYYYSKILNKPLTKIELNRLGEKFSEIALKGVLEASFIDGALATLKKLQRRNIPMFIASGTPQKEIELIIHKRELNDFFIEVHGSPRKKAEIVFDIQQRYRYQLSRCIFIGDAMSDYKAAIETGTKFLGIVNSEYPNPFPANVKISFNRVKI